MIAIFSKQSCIKIGFFFFSSRRRHTRCGRDWSSDVCSSDLIDALDCLGRDRCLVDACQIEELAPCVRPAGGLDDRAWLAVCLIKAMEPSIGVRLHQSRIARQMLLRMLAATIARIEEHG